MIQVNIHEVKTQLSLLIDGEGEAFIIVKEGKPVAKVVPLSQDIGTKTRGGFLSKKVQIPKEFNTMFQSEIEDMFYGEEKEAAQ